MCGGRFLLILLLPLLIHTFCYAQKNGGIAIKVKPCVLNCNPSPVIIQLDDYYKVKGGKPPLTYQWSGPVKCKSCSKTTTALTGSYTFHLTVTDSWGISASDSIPVKLQGCKVSPPDADKDGVIDKDDSCKFDAGPARLHGCPDRDSDQVIDKYDECPDTPGLPSLDGCPDRDKDGVADKLDLCPDSPGPKNHRGCPDTDGDGIYDNEDRCINVEGVKGNLGCPWPDADNDGVYDKDDACPKVSGLQQNNGCPELTRKEVETVKQAKLNLRFEPGKFEIRGSSYPALDALANLLMRKSEYGLRIEAYTDNSGNPEKNLAISQKRAVAVRNYLVEQGVKAGKLEANGYGEENPIADNETPEGKLKNRRVELTITFVKSHGGQSN
jgi:outer membrane protein OmpA-like peptidoglycan-associated protein